jgi:hypothetical protein
MPEPLQHCAICGKLVMLPREYARETCDNCARMTGAVALRPSQRPRLPCQRCHHDKLIRALPRELTQLQSGAAATGPMFATYEIQTTAGGTYPIHARSGFGVLEIYVCKRCGFVEWYCNDPESIPIGPAYMTEEIDLGGEGPYR